MQQIRIRDIHLVHQLSVNPKLVRESSPVNTHNVNPGVGVQRGLGNVLVAIQRYVQSDPTFLNLD